MLSHCFLEKFQGGLLIARLRHEAFQYLTFVIHSPPQVVPFTVDLHEHLIQMPAPAAGFHTLDPALSYLGSEHRAEPMPPVSHRFMTDINATFMQHVFDISKGQRETNVHHNRQADDLAARFEITKWIRFGHVWKVRNRPARLKLVLSDSALRNQLCPKLARAFIFWAAAEEANQPRAASSASRTFPGCASKAGSISDARYKPPRDGGGMSRFCSA